MRKIGRLAHGVYQGIALLDQTVPDWFLRLETETLDMRNTTECVLGQLFGELDYVGGYSGYVNHNGYDNGLERLNLESAGLPETHGFDAWWGQDSDFHHLTRIWKYAVRVRREMAE